MLLSPGIRDWLMAELRFPIMATIAPNGLPSQSAVWFDLDEQGEDTILLNTRVGRSKDRHLRRDPRLSLCFADRYTYVTVEGRAELDDDRGRALAHIQQLARRYGGDPATYEGQQRVMIRMHVERIHRYGTAVREAEARS